MSGGDEDFESQGQNLDIEVHQQDQALALKKAMSQNVTRGKPGRKSRAKKGELRQNEATIDLYPPHDDAKGDSGLPVSDDKDCSPQLVGTKRTHQF